MGYLPPALTQVNSRRKSNARTPEGDPQPICGNGEIAAEEALGQFSRSRYEPDGRQVNKHAMAAEIPKIHAIYRYPVKGLSPEPLERARLGVGATLPADRLYAIENGPSGFDPAAARHLPKQRYLMLMRNERLAWLRTRFDDASHTLVIETDGREVARGDLRTGAGRGAIELFFAGFCADELRGAPKVQHAPGFSFSDVARKVVSIINLGSVAAVENIVGAAVNPLRFRANVYVTGWPAWHEFDLLEREIAIGPDAHRSGARLRIVKRIVRCAATNVDPDTGIRDLSIPDSLMRNFGHADCGVYGEVVEAGEIAVGDGVRS
jgi:uncharacterized protein YcbX